MTEETRATDRSTTNRRRFLAGSGLAALTATSGCLGSLAAAVTTTRASPAAFYNGRTTLTGQDGDDANGEGDGADGRTYPSAHPTHRPIPVTVETGLPAVAGRVELEAWFSNGSLKAQDYNSSRSNKYRSIAQDVDADGDGVDDGGDGDGGEPTDGGTDGDSDGDGVDDGGDGGGEPTDGGDLDALYEYLAGEPVIGERFVLAVPDARVPGRGSVGEELTPRRLLDGIVAASARDGRGFSVGRSVSSETTPRLAARLELDEATGDGAGPSTGSAVLTGGDGSGSTGVLVGRPPSFANPFTKGGLDGWGPERAAGAAAVSGPVVGPVLATPRGSPSPMPAVLSVSRIRHDGQFLYAGGWTVDDGALWRDSRTLLVSGGAHEVVGIRANGESVTHGTVAAGLSRGRSRHGAQVFDGPLGRDGTEDGDALAYLPAGLRRGDGADRLAGLLAATGDGSSADDAGPLRGLIVPLDCPVLHLIEADGLSTERKNITNLVPAVNTITSR